MKTLVIATSNADKFQEIAAELTQFDVVIRSLRDFPSVRESPETGSSFAENALQKAEFYFQQFQKPVLAEDSGLVVAALNGFPDILSARIAADDSSRIQMVLDRLGESRNRSAYYVCSMALKTAEQICTVEAICRGTIVQVPKGEHGFGYYPIFQAEGTQLTFGEMSLEQKSQYSHRGKATRKMIPLLREVVADSRIRES